jgi:hypothetical protein
MKAGNTEKEKTQKSKARHADLQSLTNIKPHLTTSPPQAIPKMQDYAIITSRVIGSHYGKILLPFFQHCSNSNLQSLDRGLQALITFAPYNIMYNYH